MSAAPPPAKKGKFVQQKLCFGMPTANPEISIAAVTATTTTTSLSSLDTATTSTTSVSSVITTPAESESAVSCPEEPYHPPRNFTFPKTIQSKFVVPISIPISP